MSWKVFVNGQCVQRDKSTILSTIPDKLDHGTIMKLISLLDSVHVCHGYPKKEYIDMASIRKWDFRGKDGKLRALVDASHPVVMKGEVYPSTIRTTECALLSDSPLCSQCRDYGPVLRSTYSRWLGTSSDEVSKFTNNRYLTSPQKGAKLKQLQYKVSSVQKEKKVLEAKIEELTSKHGIEVEPSFHQDLFSIMQDSNGKVEAQFPEGSFRRLFWEQQFQSAKKGAKQMRWHPTLIR